MRRGDETISEESQPTLLLDSVLRRHAPIAKNQPPAHEYPPTIDQNSHATPSGASVRSAAPQYNFHGLAGTQTESQLEASFPPGLVGPHITPILPSITERNSGDVNQDNTSIRSPRRSDRVKDAKKVSTPGPRSPDVRGLRSTNRGDLNGPSSSTPQADVSRRPARRGRYAPRTEIPRSLSPVSQDSFAGSLPPEDKAALYVRDTEAFNIPLNQLEERMNISAGAISSSMSPYRSQSAEPISHDDTRPHSYGLTNDSIYGDAPYAQAQDPNAFEEIPDVHHGHVQNSDDLSLSIRPSSSLPSSYPRLIDSGLDSQESGKKTLDSGPYEDTQREQADITPVATQVLPESETQPAEFYTAVDAPSHIQNSSIVTGTTGTTGRGMLGLINPAKQWRMQAFLRQERDAGAIGNTQPDDSIMATYGGTEETQPSEESFTFRRRKLPPPRPTPSDAAHKVDGTPREVPESEPERRSSSPSRHGIRSEFRELSSLTAAEEESIIPGLTIPANVPLIMLRKEEEESSSDGDDIPLAATSKVRTTSKPVKPSSSKSRYHTSPEVPPPKTSINNPATSSAATRVRRRSANNRLIEATQCFSNRSWEHSIIPSSEPQEKSFVAQPPLVESPAKETSDNPTKDAMTTSTTAATAATTVKDVSEHTNKGPEPALRPRSVRKIIGSTSTVDSVTPNRKFAKAASVESDSESITGSTMPPPTEIVDQATEMGEEDVDPDPDIQTRSRKRKRVVCETKVKNEPKSATRRKASPPSSRPAKRQKSSSTTVTATRVFGLWKSDNCYYSGVVQEVSKSSGTRFLIKFDDGDKEWLDVTKIRLCQLKKGDYVLFDQRQRGTIVDCLGDGPDDTVVVEVNDGENITQHDMTLRDVRIPGRSLVNNWNDRTLVIDDVIPVVRPKVVKMSPARSGLSLASAGSSRNVRSRTLGKTGFVVTMSPGNADSEAKKKNIMRSIKVSGGQVFDDWGDIFKMEGKFQQGGKRWVINKDDVAFLNLPLDKVFLLSDEWHRKPKYLMAIALGIPCLSFKWLEACCEKQHDVPWQPYLLPAGLCEHLNARFSQVIDWDWGNAPDDLTDIMTSTVPSKIFHEKSLLCLSSDYLPKSTKVNDKAKESNGLVPKILLCMGASRVEAVPDSRYASCPLEGYDFVIVKEEEEVVPLRTQGITCVHFGWVKDCLIAGRVLDFTWD